MINSISSNYCFFKILLQSIDQESTNCVIIFGINSLGHVYSSPVLFNLKQQYTYTHSEINLSYIKNEKVYPLFFILSVPLFKCSDDLHILSI